MTEPNEYAFPTGLIGHNGMSLRDYFAAKAMQAYLSRDPDSSGAPGDKDYDKTIARWAYETADAMLRRRAEQPEPALQG